ncbi:unnamed protein product, partial [Coccothraustes coccothraustes]
LCLSRTPRAALAALLTTGPPSPSCRPVLSNSKVAQAQTPALSLSPGVGGGCLVDSTLPSCR